VELEPSVYEAARLFDAGALDDPRVERRVDDARTALRREPAGSLDVVASHPSNPWVSGAGALFSREYFQLARSRLRAGGRMLAWVQLYETDREAVRTLVATFLESFPESHAFRPSASSRDLLLLGFRDAGALRERFPTALSAEALGALRRAGVTNLDGVLALRVAGPAALARWSRGAWVSTDDNGALEYRVAAGLRRGAEATPEAVLGGLSALEVAAPPPPPPPPPLERRNLQ
jgi:spermidine synthase